MKTSVIHLRVHGPNPGDIITACGSFERLTLWRRRTLFLKWCTTIKDTTCPRCRATYLIDALKDTEE